MSADRLINNSNKSALQDLENDDLIQEEMKNQSNK